VLSSGVATAQPGERGMGGVVGITVYDDRDFRGRKANFRNDVPDLRQFGMNDRIVSFQIAPGETWEVCEHASYGGRCQVFYGYENDLRQRGWSRIISSLRRVRGGGGGGVQPPIYPPRPPIGQTRGLVLYEDRSFRGSSRTLNGATPDLRALGFNDKAESLRVPSGEVWEICRDINYVGCLQVNTDWADLGRHGSLRGEISSARPWRQGGGWDGNRPQPPVGGRSRIVLYSGVNFTGRSYTLDGQAGSINMSTVQSVRVSGGATWQICEDSNYRGRCTAASGDIGNIRSLGLPGRVRSARPMSRPY
jgi:hypothetical protein